MNTRRFPRTMDQAFGPYNRSSQCVIEPMPEKRRIYLFDIVFYASCVVGVIAAIVFNNYGG